ncbi:MAG: hypothetical protein WC824_05275 [Bacteroidota bacterium]|jgi:hypothetical protein
MLYSLLVIALLSALTGCGQKKARTLPEEAFQQIYGDILFLGELHRNDTTALRHALDSLLDVNNIDTTVLFATAREFATDAERSAELYRVVTERFEKQSKGADSLSPQNPDASKKTIAPGKPGRSDTVGTPPKPAASRKIGPPLTGKE